MFKISRINIGYQVILVLLLCSVFNFKASNKDCPQLTTNQTPKTFAIQTMTFTRSTQTTKTTQLISFLDHYANSQCACFDTIYIVWNNQRSPQQLGIQKLDQWKKKVVFTQTPYNSLGWKYVIPESAEEQLFLALDDDIKLTCRQLKQGFQQWRQYSIGQIGPLFSYVRRTMFYDEKNAIFRYENGKDTNQYAIGLMGCAFYSRQFADLYYSQYYQIRQIRKKVQLLNNCEDIALNYVVSYFYPELLPRIYVDPDSKEQFQPKATYGVSNSPQHYAKRDLCLNLFSQILSFNPLRFIQLTTDNKKLQYDRTCNILQKKNSYKKIVRRKTPQEIFQGDIKFREFESQESYYHQYLEKVYLLKMKEYKQDIDQANSLIKQQSQWLRKRLWDFYPILLIILINLIVLFYFFFTKSKDKKGNDIIQEMK